MQTNKQCLEDYLLVSRCWNNHVLSVQQRMSTEKAIKLLAKVRLYTTSLMLKHRAHKLLEAIIYQQKEPKYLQDLA